MHGAEAGTAIQSGLSPLSAAPDEQAINRACVELTNAYADGHD